MNAPSAAVATAQALIARGDHSGAIRVIDAAARREEGDALHLAALWRLIGDPLPRDLGKARGLLRRAVLAGHGDAAMTEVALVANGSGGTADFAAARRLLAHAARWHTPAAADLALVEAMTLTDGGLPRTLPESEPLANAPRLWRYRDFVTPAEAAAVNAAVADIMAPSVVADPATGQMRPHPIRTSSGAVIGPTRESLPIRAINLRFAAASGLPVTHGEAISVLHYAPGEEYRRHSDVLPPPYPRRAITMIAYLNDDFTGGETEFPALGITITPRAGDAILFDNLDRDGRAHPGAVHAGLPVARGRKQVATRWIRELPYDPWAG